MVGLTTIALLERKHGISRSLFTRYWRDVHGVMAARIQGFDSYTQHHVSPVALDGGGERGPFEGIAVVRFVSESDRDGLANSAVTPHIVRDEQNVFQRALLYNLEAGVATVLLDRGGGGDEPVGFLVFAADIDVQALTSELEPTSATFAALFDLRGSDPAAWNAIDAAQSGGCRFVAAVHGEAEAFRQVANAVAAAPSVSAYAVDETYVMVRDGRPTPVGLRGLDAVRTMEEAGADNQFTREVEQAVFGPLGRP